MTNTIRIIDFTLFSLSFIANQYALRNKKGRCKLDKRNKLCYGASGKNSKRSRLLKSKFLYSPTVNGNLILKTNKINPLFYETNFSFNRVYKDSFSFRINRNWNTRKPTPSTKIPI